MRQPARADRESKVLEHPASAETVARRQPRPEFNVRSVAVGIFVAAVIGSSYPYVVLKLGFGPTISVVSAFFGYIVLSIVGFVTTKLTRRDRRSNRYEYNIVQTAGTAAGQTAFMCVVLAAFDLLASKPALGFNLQPSGWQIFLWLSVAGCLGVLLAVPLRRHYIDEEKLTFADGTAAGETLVILDEDKRKAGRKVKALAWGGIFSAVTTWVRDTSLPKIIPSETFFGAYYGKLNVGIAWSALSFGSGLIVGLRISLSMMLGAVLAWVIAPPILGAQGITQPAFASTLRWVMWPATGLMVSGGLTALALKSKLIVKTFRDLRVAKPGSTDFPLRGVIVGAVILAIALVALQRVSMNIPIWESVVAILVSIPLMLVGTRVLGETNWAPISAMANMVQALFAALAPGSIPSNMVASGMSGTVAANGEDLMQDYKAGKIIGSNNRYLTWMQLIATPVGAAAVAIMYPLLKRTYGIGADRYGIDAAFANSGEAPLTSPISVKWAGFAEILSNGFSALPKYCLEALVIAVVLGVVITIFESKYRKYLPSPTGVGLGMLIPFIYVFPMVLGGVAQAIWAKRHPKSEDELNIPLASGLIVGEALLASLIIPLVGFVLLKYFGISLAGGGGH
jgi:putative OPT family oligopeptide transporter